MGNGLLVLGQDSMVERVGLWELFEQSIDIFTIVLLGGSLVAAAVIVRCVLDVRSSTILPQASIDRADELLENKRLGELATFAREDESFVGAVLTPALAARESGEMSIREAAEIAASAETARHFRKIELLSLIGNLGPLVGLAGTVWGMILAFTSLGATGGQAGPAELSIGISKALFHTLLGLVLAVPCLFVFGIYRAAVDRICTRGIAETSRMVDRVVQIEKAK
ncbi:MAG: MotA/TolQ/ExbB proton channel family protein [Planctomycetota bacterium]